MAKAPSTVGSDIIIRSRTWSEDITSSWTKPINASETVNDRLERYSTYFMLNCQQLRHITDRFVEELEKGLQLHAADPSRQHTAEQCSMKMLDSCVEKIPDGTERGVAYALDFGGTNLRAVRVKLDGQGHVALSQVKKSLVDGAPGKRKGLMDATATATELFDTFAATVKELMLHHADATNEAWGGVGFTFSFPIDQKTLKSANLVCWTKEFETGRATNDPVEGMDVGALLNQALWRMEVAAKQRAVLNDTVGTLLSCAYEKPRRLPQALIGMIIGTGVNGCYYQEDAKDYGYKGRVLNTELGGFDKGLPLNDVDLEVDFHGEATRGSQVFEKMVSGRYLGEVCRRLIIKVYQTSAPELAWIVDSMPAEATAMIANDATAALTETKKVLEGLWEWDAAPQDLKTVKRLAVMVLDRSAALCAAVIAGMAKRTKRLSPGMGGLTVGIDGSLYTQNEWYAQKLRHHLDVILGDSASLVHLTEANDGSGKGAAILAATTPKEASD